ncbi:MAG: methyltransferase domain-containing protein [Planctomycetota bacterium]|nr:MAG: methyltransferase domain-containing protein [Planctomycetota bacterium]
MARETGERPMNQPTGRTHRTPESALRGERVEPIRVGGHTLKLLLPEQAHTLLDDPFVEQAFEADEYMPYWAELWPAARMLAEALLHQPPAFPVGTRALEVGCGLGLVSAAGLLAGLHMTITDYDLTAVEFARRTALANAPEGAIFTAMALDWRSPPPVRYPLIVGADLLYEERSVAPLLSLLTACLEPGGQAWICDPDRANGKLFGAQAGDLGMVLEARAVHSIETDGRRIGGTLYRLGLPRRGTDGPL